MKIGIGVFFLLAIIILFVLSLKNKKKEKAVKKINITLYILVLIFLVSLSFSAIIGIDYACPCGCGSTEFDTGFKGMLNFFNEISYGIFDMFILYAMYVVKWCVVAHLIILGIRMIIKKNKMNKKKK